MNLKHLIPELSFITGLAEHVSYFLFDPEWKLLDSQVSWEAFEQRGAQDQKTPCFVDPNGGELQEQISSQERGDSIPGYIVLSGETEALPVFMSWARKQDGSTGTTAILLIACDRSYELSSNAWRECYKRRDSLCQFLRKLSHDLNNIISPLSSSTALLHRKLKDENDLTRCTTILDRGLERVGEFSKTLQAFSIESTSQGPSTSIRALRAGVVHQLESLFFQLPKIEWESGDFARELSVPEGVGVTLVSQLVEGLLENGGVRVSERYLSPGHEDLPEAVSSRYCCEISIVSTVQEGGGGALKLPFEALCPLALIREQTRLPESLVFHLAKGYGGHISSVNGLKRRSIFLPVVEAR